MVLADKVGVGIGMARANLLNGIQVADGSFLALTLYRRFRLILDDREGEMDPAFIRYFGAFKPLGDVPRRGPSDIMSLFPSQPCREFCLKIALTVPEKKVIGFLLLLFVLGGVVLMVRHFTGTAEDGAGRTDAPAKR